MNPVDRRVRFRFRHGGFSDLQGDAGQKKMCENGFAGQQGLIEKSGRANAEPARLKVAPFMEEQQPLIQIQ